jgi:protein-L-isoaspartate(D-aspartate) O-methyltransferase
MDIETARQQMIDQQVRAAEVLDPRVLEALGQVPRERFVPPAFRDVAFADAPIPLPEGQSMLAPKLDGRILQACDIAPGDSVVEVGAGSGYLAACVAALGGDIDTLEIRPALAAFAAANLRAAGFPGVRVHATDATSWQPRAPVDVVVFSASLPEYDRRYEAWLKPGGRLFVAVGTRPPMSAHLVRRTASGAVTHEEVFETMIDPLTHARRPSAFVF